MLTPFRRILYVDDDKDSRELVEFVIKRLSRNYEITTVGSSAEALALLNFQPFDLYILDYRLAEMNGVELCRRIRQTDVSTPVMFCTAMSNQSAREDAMDAGANDYLVKPVDIDILIETVEKLLRSKEKSLSV
jgi:CheY-like chemotaxis protein